MTTATTRTFRTTPSPAAHIVGLPEGVTLTSLRTFRSNHGEGLCANLKVDGKVIGTLEDDGHGGGTWFRPSVVHAEGIAVVDRLVKDWYAARAAAGLKDEHQSEESLWNDLVEEAVTLRDLKKKGLHVSKGEPRQTIDCGDWSYKAVEYATYPKLSPATFAPYVDHLKKDGFTHVFNGTEWVTL